MANPQIENGHARIANELIEALSQINLSAYEWRVLMCILRKTYGWNRKSDYISVSQIAKRTGLLRSHACRAKRSLLGKKLLVEHNGLLGPNKDYDTWSVINSGTVTDLGNKTSILNHKQRNVTDSGTVTDSGNIVTNPGNKTLPIQALQKTIKTPIQKTNDQRTFDGSNLTGSKAANNNGELFDHFWSEYPRKVGKANCQKIWKRLKPSVELTEKIITAIKAYKRTDQWQKHNGQFIPHPATWLNQARWDDEIQAAPEPNRGEPGWLPTESEAEDIMRDSGIEFENE